MGEYLKEENHIASPPESSCCQVERRPEPLCCAIAPTDQTQKARFADAIAAICSQVAFTLIGSTHIRQDNREYFPVDLTTFD